MFDGQGGWTWITSEARKVWVAVDGAQRRMYIDASKLHKLYVARNGPGDYKVVGALGDSDIAIKMGLQSEAEATEWLDDFIKKIM